MTNLLKIAYAPAFFLGFIGTGVALTMSGAPSWTLGLVLLAAIATSLTVERIIPYERDWNRDKKDTFRDIVHACVNESGILLAALAIPLLAALSPFSVWPNNWPVLVQLAMAIIVCDLGITFMHRLSHSVEWLWPFHAPHHSIKRLYGFNGLMKHPVHQTLEIALGTGPLILMGLETEVATLLGLSVACQLLLQHSNVDMKIGQLRHVWGLAPVHRFHHVNKAGEGDVNFGLFTTLGDRLMGTLHHDDATRFSAANTGIEDRDDYPTGYLAQLAQPFRDLAAMYGKKNPEAPAERDMTNVIIFPDRMAA